MDKRKAINRLFVFCFLAVATAAMFFIGRSASFAYAAADTDAVPTALITATTGFEFTDSGDVKTVRGVYNEDSYASNIVIAYELSGATHYRIDLTVDGFFIEGRLTEAKSDVLEYPVEQSGEVTVKLTAFNASGAVIGTVTKTVLSDTEKPVAPDIEVMDRWLKDGEVYNAVFPLKDFSDGLSGLGDIYYRFDGRKKGEIHKAFGINVDDPKLDNINFLVEEAGVLYIYCFDRAYNCRMAEYNYDKFDFTAPPVPAINAVPNVPPEAANGYAASFTVSIDFFADAKSGLAEKQYYAINGQTQEYKGAFELSSLQSYEIRATAQDNAGNLSEPTVYSIPLTAFDKTDPSIVRVQTVTDIRNSPACRVTVNVYDEMSGVGRVYIDDGVGINLSGSGAADTYTVDIDAYERTGLVIKVEDRVGNIAIKHVALNYFGSDLADKFKRYSEIYRALDFSAYSESAQTAINDNYTRINSMIAANAPRSDFDTAFSALDATLNGLNKFVYSIKERPEYLSGALTFEVINTGDFDGFKLGDEIKLVMSGYKGDGNYLAQAGFSQGFYDFFELKILYNGTEVGTLENGIKISLNMPVNFYERQYALIDKITGETVPVSAVSNKLEFVIKNSSSFVLVISGKNTPTGTEGTAKKTVSVFGNKLSYGAFFGTVFGVLGGVAVIITIMIILMKKRGNRH